jgi:hypothetical protein
MEQTTQKQNRKLRGLLIKKPFYRLLPDVPDERTPNNSSLLRDLGEKAVVRDNKVYMEETQADFQRQFDPESHAINDRNVYINYRKGSDGLYYEEDFPRYAEAYQQEIFRDRMARTTGNDIQFDLADDVVDDKNSKTYNKFKAGWADKRMENAWHFSIKSDYKTADTAFVGILTRGKFSWKVLSYDQDDILYPHYDRISGELSVFARTYQADDDDGNSRNYIDVWDDKFYYRLVNELPDENKKDDDTEGSGVLSTMSGDYDVSGYVLEEKRTHGFDSIPVAYHRRDDGPVWSASQETIEHHEAAFSRLAQNNHDFGLPIMYLKGNGKQMKEIATQNMSYASKIFIIPSEGDAGFMNRQDASGAYKTELDMLDAKIYSQSGVVKAPELKSGDTPAAAIKLLYSDAFTTALLEIQEYDEFLCKMIEIFKWGYGIETNSRLDFMNTRISFYITPFIPINDQEVTTNLATAVQNGFCSKQTASEKFYFSTPQEWDRIQKEKHDEKQQELLIEEQRLDMQNDANVEMQEELADIETEQQIEVIKAQGEEEGEEDRKAEVKTRKGRVNTGRGRGRPRTVGTDKWGNRENENNWGSYNATH